MGQMMVVMQTLDRLVWVHVSVAASEFGELVAAAEDGTKHMEVLAKGNLFLVHHKIKINFGGNEK